MISNYLRKKVSRYFTKQDEIAFRDGIPLFDSISEKINGRKELGIYLHIPFCDQICPYCSYNKEIFKEETSRKYVQAVKQEIDQYASVLSEATVTSFYIGGGTPTTMIKKGIDEIINYLYRQFKVECGVHMEGHPNHLTPDNLTFLKSIGVDFLSIGVEALQDKYLKFIERPYTAQEVKKNIGNAVDKGFKCVNIDLIFDLPGQTPEEMEIAANEVVRLKVNQVATYPLFKSSYTRLGKGANEEGYDFSTMFRRRKLLKALEEVFYSSGYERSSVWAFTRKGTDKNCSGAVPLYIGLGASGGSYLNNIFYVNTFSVKEYINALTEGKSPVALSVDLSKEMQMSGWLYWHIYETKFLKSDFFERFKVDFDAVYGRQIKTLSRLGFLEEYGNTVFLTDKGKYWIHAFEDFFSIDYISNLQRTPKNNPWPEKTVL